MYKILPILLFAFGLCGLDSKDAPHYLNLLLLNRDIINEIDTTIDYSDEVTAKIKEKSDNYQQELYDSLNETLVSLLNPEKFNVGIELSLEHTAFYDSSSISIELTKNGNVKFYNKTDNFNFISTRDSLMTSYEVNGLLSKWWFFIEEDLSLFFAVKPKIDIYIDNSLEIDRFRPTLIPLLNEILNYTGRSRPLTPNPIDLIKYDKFEGRINFISTDIQKLRKSLLTSQSISLNREDI
ncbi:uncharacterized protein METZ01_LOCUS461395, partial [marine metagenome]